MGNACASSRSSADDAAARLGKEMLDLRPLDMTTFASGCGRVDEGEEGGGGADFNWGGVQRLVGATRGFPASMRPAMWARIVAEACVVHGHPELAAPDWAYYRSLIAKSEAGMDGLGLDACLHIINNDVERMQPPLALRQAHAVAARRSCSGSGSGTESGSGHGSGSGSGNDGADGGGDDGYRNTGDDNGSSLNVDEIGGGPDAGVAAEEKEQQALVPEPMPSVPDEAKERVRRVLVAFALHNSQVQYCQGMDRIAAMFLRTLDEASAFAALVLAVECVIVNYHSKALAGVLEDTEVLRLLLQDRFPQVLAKIDDVRLTLVYFTVQWFVTAFADSTAEPVALRIWDTILAYSCDGRDASRVLLAATMAAVRLILDEITLCATAQELDAAFRACLTAQAFADIDYSDAFFDLLCEEVDRIPKGRLARLRKQVRDKGRRPDKLPVHFCGLGGGGGGGSSSRAAVE